MIQHNFTASLTGGYRDNGNNTPNPNTPAWLDTRYTFGLYPTTRTYFSISALGGVYLNGSEIGYTGGVSSDNYFYVSPRFRFELNAAMRYGENYDAHGFNHVGLLNPGRITKEISYSFNLGLPYNIF